MRNVALLAALAIGAGASGQDASAPAKAAPKVEDLAWLAGHWRGEGFGGTVEEIWSAPLGGTMVGTFRLVKDGQVAFYEIVLLVADAEGVALRVKHFHPDFVGWEEKDQSVDFRLESVEGQEATFKGLKIRRKDEALEIELRMRSKDGSARWEKLAFTRYRP